VAYRDDISLQLGDRQTDIFRERIGHDGDPVTLGQTKTAMTIPCNIQLECYLTF
jgi:hypothetical protein